MSNLGDFNIFIAPDGEQYRIDTEACKFLIGFEGWGMPPIEYITRRGPFQHGATVDDFRLLPRVLQLLISRQGDNRFELWDNREALIDILRPNRDDSIEGVLRKILPNGDQRDLTVVIEDGPKFSRRQANEWRGWDIVENLRFIAHDPTLFDPTSITFTFALASQDELVFPITFPITFGGSVIDETENITYTGTWLSYPTIVITGPMDNPKITNNSTTEKIELSYNVSAGEIVTITLEYGNKTITNDSGTNLIGTRTADSDLATFHLEVSPKVAGGINSVRVQGGGATLATQVQLTYNTRFIGI